MSEFLVYVDIYRNFCIDSYIPADPAYHSYNADPGVDDQDSVVLEVHRHHVFNDMVRFFRRDDILATNLKFKMINGAGKAEKAEDVGGVFREVLTLFWKEF